MTRVEPIRAGGAAWSLTASDGSGLRLTGLDAKVVIEGPLAFTELHLRFHNPEPRTREGTFAITLPPNAAISRFAMQELDHVKEAEVVPKALARRAYDDFLHRRIDPALLEKAPGNQFTARVFPIPGNGDKHLVISYSQELTNEAYTLPLRGLPRIDTVSINVRALGEGGAIRTQTLAEKSWQPERDFVANVESLPAVGDGVLAAGAFAVGPPQLVAAEHPSTITLLVDTSASRALGFTHYVSSVHALVATLAARYQGLRLDVIAFDQTTRAIYSGPATGFGYNEISALVARGPGGASDLARAATFARGRTVIVTDGVVTAGSEGVELGKAFASAERVDVVLAGGIRDDRVARLLARGGRRPGDVFDLDREVTDVIATGLGQAVHVDVPVEVANAMWFYPKKLPSLRVGSQVLVYARLQAPAATFDVTIDGHRQSVPIAHTTPALLQRAVARVDIDELETALAATAATDNANATRLRDEIARKSVAARVVSSETTMLILDTEDDYARYGISRKALADILVVGPNGLEQTKRTFVAAHGSRGTSSAVPGSDTPDPSSRSEGQFAMSLEQKDPALARAAAIEQARAAGILGSSATTQGGAFASLNPSGDISSGFDDTNIYGPLTRGHQSSSGVGYGRGGSGRGAMRGRVAAVPTVSIGQPTSMGSLDKAIIRRYIKRHINQISYCYERELMKKPMLVGTVMTQFFIAPGGNVQSASASGVDADVASCIADVIKTIKFPTVKDSDGGIQVNYPFSFHIAGTEPPPAPAPVASMPEPPPVEPSEKPPARPFARPIDALDGKLRNVMKLLARKNTAAALTLATTWRNEQPGDVLAWIALGEALEARGDREGAARAYGSIIDLFGARAEYRRFAGERLERTGERALAIDTYRRAAADRPDQLTGHRLLANALLRSGDYAGAFAAILKGVDQNVPEDRYAGAPKLFARDAGMIAAAYIAHGGKHDDVMAALNKRGLSLVTKPSTRFILYWETDANDVDLHVRDKTGDEAFFGSRTLATGGDLFADVTTGFGPECFEINGKPPAAPYELAVHYYAQGPMGYGMGLLQIERFDGSSFTFDDRPFVIMKNDAWVSLGKTR